MKKLLLIASAFSILLVSCSKDKTEPVDGDKGSIVINGSTNPIVDMIETKAGDMDDYFLQVTGTGDYTLKGLLKDNRVIDDLNAGAYTVTLTSHDLTTTTPMPAFDTPIYQGTDTKTVSKGVTTEFALECTQINVGIQFKFDASITAFYENLKATIAVKEGSGSLEYTPADETDNKIAYFNPSELVISLKNGDTSVDIGGKSSVTIETLKRQLWTITLKTSSSGNGGPIQIEASVNTGTDPQTQGFGVGNAVGKGTYTTPYSVNDAINVMPAKNVWVEGVIVGATTINITRTESEYVDDNILLGQTANTPEGKCIAILLSEESMKAALNLVNNPDNVGRKIRIKGDILNEAADFTSPAFAAISNVTDYDLVEDRTVLKDAPFPVGAAIHTKYLNEDPAYVNTVRKEFNSITAESEMKMSTIATERDPKKWDWTKADELVAFAEARDMRIHGHTLVWYYDVPGWLKNGSFTKEEVMAFMEEYITAVIQRYQGRIKSWDVVNEAFNGNGTIWEGDNGEYRNFWYEVLKEDYIKLAFQYAKKAVKGFSTGAECKLFYNDHLLVWDKANGGKLSETIFDNLIPDLKNEGLIDGIGIQMHIEANYAQENLTTLLEKAVASGLLVHLSEVCVEIKGSTQESVQKETYKQIFSNYINKVPKAQQFGITLWGVTDKYSYLKTEKNPNPCPLPFDDDYNRKEAYYGIIDAITTTEP